MSMRMVPIRQTFQKMARLVRDLSKQVGQDRRPRAGRRRHRARSQGRRGHQRPADAHGPQQRRPRHRVARRRAVPAGKPAQARLALSAYHQGGNIVIAIADDGAGLNTERILEKAIAQGLIAADDDADARRDPSADLPAGLLDRREGHRDLRPRRRHGRRPPEHRSAARADRNPDRRPAQGTTFLIKLPLTLAILDGLLLRDGEQRFVLPTFCDPRVAAADAASRCTTFQGRAAHDSGARLAAAADSPVGAVRRSPGRVPEPCEATVVVIEDDGRRVGAGGGRAGRQAGSGDQVARRARSPTCAASPAARFSATAGSG